MIGRGRVSILLVNDTVQTRTLRCVGRPIRLPTAGNRPCRRRGAAGRRRR
jgi:hypothetical protein